VQLIHREVTEIQCSAAQSVAGKAALARFADRRSGKYLFFKREANVQKPGELATGAECRNAE